MRYSWKPWRPSIISKRLALGIHYLVYPPRPCPAVYTVVCPSTPECPTSNIAQIPVAVARGEPVIGPKARSARWNGNVLFVTPPLPRKPFGRDIVPIDAVSALNDSAKPAPRITVLRLFKRPNSIINLFALRIYYFRKECS